MQVDSQVTVPEIFVMFVCHVVIVASAIGAARHASIALKHDLEACGLKRNENL